MMVSQWNFNLMQDQELLSFAFTSKTKTIKTLLRFNQFTMAAIFLFDYKGWPWFYVPQFAAI